MQRHKYTIQESQFMEEYVPGHCYAEIQKAFIENFGWDITRGQIKSYISNHHLNTGQTGYFKKGQKPFNKGKKGVCAAGCEKTWFKKGQIPHNHRPVGSERMDKGGYIKVKTGEPNEWRMKHRVVWESAHGAIPKGYMILFRDNDRTNTDLGNLVLVKRSTNAILNNTKLCNYNGELKETAIGIAELMAASSKARKRKKDGKG